MLKITAVLATIALLVMNVAAHAKSAAELNDLQIAHVAYTADLIDIRYAHLALAKSKNPAIHKFARTMIRDHSAVNKNALALLKKLNAAAQDNFLSRQLNGKADQLVQEMSQLRVRLSIAAMRTTNLASRATGAQGQTIAIYHSTQWPGAVALAGTEKADDGAQRSQAAGKVGSATCSSRR